MKRAAGPRELPIPFVAPMVCEMRAGRKTQTRRLIRTLGRHGAISEFKRSDTPGYDWTFRDDEMRWQDYREERLLAELAPYRVGDRLWTREAYRLLLGYDKRPPSSVEAGLPIRYEADGLGDRQTDGWLWGKRRPGMFMMRWMSRDLLEVTDVRIQRISDISEADCIAEGCSGGHGAIPVYGYNATPREHFFHVITSINSEEAINEFAFAYTFKRLPK